MGLTPGPGAEIVIGGITGAILAVATLTGATAALGAHPWWAVQTGLVGTAAGLALYATLRIIGAGPRHIGLGAAFALVVSSLGAWWGKQAFVASFADSALAGRFWYFGWFAIAGSAAIVLTVLALQILRR